MLKVTSKIPEQYLKEYLDGQIVFIKNRVQLFCALAVSIYFFASFAWFMLYPEELSRLELFAGLFLMMGGSLILFFNTKTRTLHIAKFNAYLFVTLMLALLVMLGIYYNDDPATSSSMFVFTLFFVSLTIPWAPAEVVIIGLLHAIAYTLNFLILARLNDTVIDSVEIRQYLEGFLFMCVAFILCVVVRFKETTRDIENFVLLKEIRDKNEQARKELALATRVQKTLVPASISTDRVDIAVTYLPVYYIGGDYVRFNFLDNDRMIFIVSDVTGHGVSAALLVNRLHTEFERFAKEGKEPGPLLQRLNEFIKEDFEGTDMYLSAFCGLLDFKKMRLLYSNYGHPPQYVYSAKNNELRKLPAQTGLLGLPVDNTGIYQDEAEVDKGDRILLFTDGVIETFRKDDEEYGSGRLEDFLLKNHSLSGRMFNQKLLQELDDFKEDNKFKDDIYIVDVTVKGHKPILPFMH